MTEDLRATLRETVRVLEQMRHQYDGAHDEVRITRQGWNDGIEPVIEFARAALATPATGADEALPCAIQVDGSLGSGVLIPGVAYRVAEVREHWEPSGIEGEPPKVTTVIRFDPATPATGPRGLTADEEREIVRAALQGATDDQ